MLLMSPRRQPYSGERELCGYAEGAHLGLHDGCTMTRRKFVSD